MIIVEGIVYFPGPGWIQSSSTASNLLLVPKLNKITQTPILSLPIFQSSYLLPNLMLATSFKVALYKSLSFRLCKCDPTLSSIRFAVENIERDDWIVSNWGRRFLGVLISSALYLLSS